MIHRAWPMRTAVCLALAWLVAALPAAVAAAPQRVVAAPAGATGPPSQEQLLQSYRGRHLSSALAIAMSAPVPGWGQLYADSPFWAAVAFGAEMFYLGSVLLEGRRLQRQRVARDMASGGERELRSRLVDEHRERMRDYVWWSAGGLLLVSLDAFVSIELSGFEEPGVPVPDLDRDWQQGAVDGGGPSLALHLRF